MFGEISLMYDCPRSATVAATTDASVWVLERDIFRCVLPGGSTQAGVRTVRPGSYAGQMQGTRLPRPPRPYRAAVDGMQLAEQLVYGLLRSLCRHFVQASVEDEKGQIQLFLNTVPLLSSLRANDKMMLSDAFQEETFAGAGAEAVLHGLLVAGRLTRTRPWQREAPCQEPMHGQGPWHGSLCVLPVRRLAHKRRATRHGADRGLGWCAVLAAGARVIVEGDVGDKFYIIKEGEAKVVAGDKEVNRLFRSDFFGEQALLQDEPRWAGGAREGGQGNVRWGWRIGAAGIGSGLIFWANRRTTKSCKRRIVMIAKGTAAGISTCESGNVLLWGWLALGGGLWEAAALVGGWSPGHNGKPCIAE